MIVPAFLLTFLFVQAVVGEDKLEDVLGLDGILSYDSPELATEGGTSRDTRNYGYYSRWDNSGRRNGQSSWTTTAVDRIMDGLLRTCNGDIEGVLALLERRYNVRVTRNASLYARLDAIVEAACSQLESSGYSYYRSVVNGVADRIRVMIRARAQISGSAQISGNAQISGSAQFSGSSSLSSSSSNRWQSSGSVSQTSQASGSAQGSSNRPAQGAFIQDSLNYWLTNPENDNREGGPRPPVPQDDSAEDEWPPRRRTG